MKCRWCDFVVALRKDGELPVNAFSILLFHTRKHHPEHFRTHTKSWAQMMTKARREARARRQYEGDD